MATSCIVSCILVLLQILFGIIGLVFLGIGVVGRFFADMIWGFVKPMLDGALSAIGQSMSGVEVGNLDVVGILKSVGVPFIVIGVFLLAISILGCCGACCKSRVALLVYGIILVVILLAQVIFAIVIGTGWKTYREKVVDGLKNVIKDEYQGVNGTNMATFVLNFLFMQFECCGVTNYTDTHAAKQWNRTTDGFTIPGTAITVPAGTMDVPATCCVMNGTFPNMDPVDPQACLTAPTTATANIDKGCFEVVDSLLQDQKPMMIGIAAGVMGVQLLIIVMVFVLYSQLADSKVGPV